MATSTTSAPHAVTLVSPFNEVGALGWAGLFIQGLDNMFIRFLGVTGLHLVGFHICWHSHLVVRALGLDPVVWAYMVIDWGLAHGKDLLSVPGRGLLYI